MAFEQREQIIAASLQIDALRRELAEAESQLERLLNGKRPDNGAATKKQRATARTDDDVAIIPPKATDQDLSLTDRIVALLEANPEWEFSAQEILGLLPGTNLNSIRSALHRLAEDTRIERRSRGNFGSNRSPKDRR